MHLQVKISIIPILVASPGYEAAVGRQLCWKDKSWLSTAAEWRLFLCQKQWCFWGTYWSHTDCRVNGSWPYTSVMPEHPSTSALKGREVSVLVSGLGLRSGDRRHPGCEAREQWAAATDILRERFWLVFKSCLSSNTWRRVSTELWCS